MNTAELKMSWWQEENIAQIHGWDFSHIHGRYEEEHDLPWDYESKDGKVTGTIHRYLIAAGKSRLNRTNTSFT